MRGEVNKEERCSKNGIKFDMRKRREEEGREEEGREERLEINRRLVNKRRCKC